jgi:hypothetical protein
VSRDEEENFLADLDDDPSRERRLPTILADFDPDDERPPELTDARDRLVGLRRRRATG